MFVYDVAEFLNERTIDSGDKKLIIDPKMKCQILPTATV